MKKKNQVSDVFAIYRVWKENNGLKLVNLGERSDEERNCGWKNFLIFAMVLLSVTCFSETIA